MRPANPEMKNSAKTASVFLFMGPWAGVGDSILPWTQGGIANHVAVAPVDQHREVFLDGAKWQVSHLFLAAAGPREHLVDVLNGARIELAQARQGKRLLSNLRAHRIVRHVVFRKH